MGLGVKEILKIAENRLREEGCLDPRLDAELLLGHMLNEERGFFFLHADKVLEDNQCEIYFQLVDKRASGVPLQHITGHQEFMGIRFLVNDDVLIPRQDTELLVEEALAELTAMKKPLGKSLNVLDLCTGSGAIAVSLCYYEPKVKMTAIDLSERALEVAKINAGNYSASKGITFLHGDLFDPIGLKRNGRGKHTYHMIVSNPPYINTDVIETLQREVRDYEPRMALDGGATGLDFYERIIAEAPKYLKPGGILLLEIGYDQEAAVVKLATKGKAFQEVRCLKDLALNPRIVVCKL